VPPSSPSSPGAARGTILTTATTEIGATPERDGWGLARERERVLGLVAERVKNGLSLVLARYA
jgi:hypothetical protein